MHNEKKQTKKRYPTDAEREQNTVNWILSEFIRENFTANLWLDVVSILLEVGHTQLHDHQLKSAMELIGFINRMQLVKQKMMLEKVEIA